LRGGHRHGKPVAKFTEGTNRVLDNAARGAGHRRNGAAIRFGIRWDDGRRPKRALLPLVAALGALLLAPSAHAQSVAPSAAASSEVVRTAAGLAGTPDGAGVGVALLDSGVVPVAGLDRPGALVVGPDFSDEGDDPDLAGLDTFGHGTHLAGIIAGQDPETGFEGVAPGARVISVKVAGADGVTSLAQVLDGMEWVREHREEYGIRVLNLSLGTQGDGDYRRDFLAWKAEQLWKDGIAVVASAGNDGAGSHMLDMPAADPYVIAVGASDTNATPDPADDRVADFSSRSFARAPDLVAPGTGIVSARVAGATLDEEFPGARVGDAFFRGSGTSQAAAVVSGVAARLLAQRPQMTPDQLKALLRAGAVDLPDPASADGAGRVDAARSAALPTPGPEAIQRWTPSAPDLKKLRKRGNRELETGATNWNGRRWSGMKWSGRRWSGMKWAGMKWSGMKWSGAEWDAGS
jgi:serine protease AprX